MEKREKRSGEKTLSLLLFFVIVNGIIQTVELEGTLSQAQQSSNKTYKTLDDSWFLRLTVSLGRKKKTKLRSTKRLCITYSGKEKDQGLISSHYPRLPETSNLSVYKDFYTNRKGQKTKDRVSMSTE